MNIRLPAAAAILLSIATPVTAHRLDEYLQATLIAVEKNRLEVQVRLTPGVAVLPFVLAGIDTNADGVISESEQRVYAERVLGDLSVAIDGDRLRPTLVSMRFPATWEMKEGLGEIRLEFSADLPRNGSKRKLIFENHHQSRIAAYLVNCLVPRDPDIRLIAQNRNDSQSLYELDYVEAGVGSDPLSFAWWSGARGWLGTAALLLFARLALLWWSVPKQRTMRGSLWCLRARRL
jgi:hypothetical protein